MKKTLLLAALFVAIASLGGSTLQPASAHAQSLTPDQASTMQQQLTVLKAKLINLQMQEGIVPAGDAELPGASASVSASAPAATTLSTSDLAAVQTALTALKSMLVSIQSAIAANPQIVTQNQAGIA